MQNYRNVCPMQKGFPPDRTYVLDQEIRAEGAVNCSEIEGLLIAGSCPPEFLLDTELYRAFLIEDSPLRIGLYRREDAGIEESRRAAENGVDGLVKKLEELGYMIEKQPLFV